MEETAEFVCKCGKEFHCEGEANDHDFLIGHKVVVNNE